MKKRFEWTEARKAKLRELWLTDMASLQVADALGTSRQSASAQAYRMGLSNKVVAYVPWSGRQALQRQAAPGFVADTRNFTSRFCGDPPPGRSALDQKNRVFHVTHT